MAERSRRPGSEGLITLSTLSSQLGFLPSTPAWPEVQRAMDRLVRAPAAVDPEFAQDVRTVGAYARMLGDNREVLTRTLVTGLALGRIAVSGKRPRSLGEQMLSGLKALAWGRDAGSTDLEHLLILMWEWTRRQGLELGETMVAVDPSWDLQEWARVTKRRLSEVAEQVKPSRTLVENARTESWRHWERRAEAFVAGAPLGTELSGDEVLCRAAGVTPATVLRPQMRDMTIQDWSRLIYLAFAKEVSRNETVPRWMGEAAIRILGFSAGGPARPYRVLIVRRDRESQTRRWIPTEEAAAIAWTLDEWEAMQGQAELLVRQLYLNSELAVIAIELPSPDSEHERTVVRGLRDMAGSENKSRVGIFYFDATRPSEPPRPAPFFLAQQLSDLVSIARSRASDPDRWPSQLPPVA